MTGEVWCERQSGWVIAPRDARQHGDVDYGRVIHSASFRRLQGKTQVLNLGDSDFYRTRLTHSIEVAQIAGGLALQMAKKFGDHHVAPYLPDRAMIQAVGATHDLGHPPFGHGGEVALNYGMRDHGGFEGNGQTLRILSKLEKFSKKHGADLTRRTLLGVLKYPVAYSQVRNPKIIPQLNASTCTIKILDREQSKPPKCYMDSEQDVVSWILDPISDSDRNRFTAVGEDASGGKLKHYKSEHKSLDCSIMDLADDISFAVHDFEDAVALELLPQAEFRKQVSESTCKHFVDHLSGGGRGDYGNDIYDGWVKLLYSDGNARKHQINKMVAYFVMEVDVAVDDGFDEPLLRYRATLPEGAKRFLKALKDVVRESVIYSPEVQQLEFKGQNMVVSVFEALSSEPEKLLPVDARERWKQAGEDLRVICDHVAGMTDGFLLKTYERLFSPGLGSVFDKL